MAFNFTDALFALVFFVAVVDWVSVYKGWKRIEYIAKPATLVFLLAWLAIISRFEYVPLIFFGLGLLFSLVGDVFLVVHERWFIAGLLAFLLAHIMYIIGFNLPLPNVSLAGPLSLAIILGVSAAWILRRIIAGLKTRGNPKLIFPVAVYAAVITIMLFSSLLTNFRPDWLPWAAILVSIGAVLFFLSDILLAWNKFINPIKNGRVMNMMAYYLGQIALILGILNQLGLYPG